MFKNYVTIAFRHLLKYKAYSSINILGLAVGIASCLLISIYIAHELSYDRFHSNASQIYRIVSHQQPNDELVEAVITPLALAERMKNDFPEIKYAARFGEGWSGIMNYEDKQFHEPGLFFADAEILKIFDFEMVQGNPETALQRPNGMVITEEIAKKYFGNENPLGKTLTYEFEGAMDFEITGVIKKIPNNSHFHFDFLAPVASQSFLLERDGENFGYDYFPTYLLLSDEKEAENLEKKLPNFVSRYYPEDLKEKTRLTLQPLTDIHLYSHYEYELEVNNSRTNLYFFGGMGLMILLIACINYMNLATARSAKRAHEVGVRKVLGANREQLISQFMGEAIVFTFLAVLISAVLANLFLPIFNELTGKSLSLGGDQLGMVILLLLGLGTLVGFIVGSYPAFFLSAFSPISVLKGFLSNAASGVSLRKGLVVGQFAVSIFFLIGIIVMTNQLKYLQNRPLGFSKEQILYIPSPQERTRMNFELYKNELKAVPGVIEVTGAGSIPSAGGDFLTTPAKGENMANNNFLDVVPNFVEMDYVPTFGLEILKGRNFSRDYPSDPRETLIVNETAVAAMGWKGNPIGKYIVLYQTNGVDTMFAGRIIGVVKDFHSESLHAPVKPMVLTCRPVFTRTYVALRVETNQINTTIKGIEAAWKRLAPQWPAQITFLDETINELYEQEQRLSQVVGLATFLAIFVACLGLLGLVAFSAEQRTKEIGIRKVFGASVTNVVALLSKDFIRLILIAFLIAIPIAWWATTRWLEGFAYRIDIQWWMFALAGISALFIALLTISFQAIKAAMTNPVDSLKTE
ncbi:MAG: ABC transporter permease [Saprospiraceae bacterium]|nr:ABC transporter permease [Saprospiraceae bacterium]